MRVFRTFGVLAVAVFAFVAPAPAPAAAQDATLAPADESFGRFNLSVLAVANAIRDSAARVDDGADPRTLISGPLAFATDAIHAWETRYPNDPWIAKDLVALEGVYVKIPGGDAARLATATEAWLVADYPESPLVAKARALLAGAQAALAPQAPSAPSGAWERFAAMRVPLPAGQPR